MSKTSESAREGFDDVSLEDRHFYFLFFFYFRVINYLANFTRAVPLRQLRFRFFHSFRRLQGQRSNRVFNPLLTGLKTREPARTLTSTMKKISIPNLKTRVYNERKRVSNALYGPCNMCSESHTPGIQTLTNESARFK